MTSTTTRFLLICALFCTLFGRAQTSSSDVPLTEAQITDSKLPMVQSPWCTPVPVKVLPVPASDQQAVCSQHMLTWEQCRGKKMEVAACPCYEESGPPSQPSLPNHPLPSGSFIKCYTEAVLLDGHDLRRDIKHANAVAQRKVHEDEQREQDEAEKRDQTVRERTQSEAERRTLDQAGLVSCVVNGKLTRLVKARGQSNFQCHLPDKGEPGYDPFR